MKKHTLFIVAFLIISLSFAQTSYTNGFNTGYKKGFCQDQGIGCIEPIPPISPIPKIGESSDSYNDGYNRGFQTGLNARKSNSNSNERTRYKTAKSKFIDFVYKPNYDLQFAIIENITKGLKEAGNEFKKGNYDNTIFLSKKILSIIPEQLMANQLISLSFLGKYSNSNNPSALIEAYNYALKSDRLSNGNELSKKTNEKINELIISFAKKDDFTSILEIMSRINYKNNLTNYWQGFSYYFEKDYINAKKYLSKVKDFEPAKQYLESIRSKKYYSNPYVNSTKKNTNKTSNDNNQHLSEIQNHFQKKEFNIVIEKLKPIETKIKQGVITDKKTLFFTYSILAYSHYYKNNLVETIKYTTQAIDNSIINEIGSFYFLRARSKSNIGDYYGANNDYDYLIENYKKINYNSNSLATLYNNKGYNLILLKKYKEAKPLINKAISLDKETDYIWETKGELEYYLGNYSDAISAMSKSIKIKPSGSSYYFRGLAKIELGDKEKGCSDLSKAGEMGKTKAYIEIKKKCN